MASTAPRPEPVPAIKGPNKVLIFVMEMRPHLARGDEVTIRERRVPFDDTLQATGLSEAMAPIL